MLRGPGCLQLSRPTFVRMTRELVWLLCGEGQPNMALPPCLLREPLWTGTGVRAGLWSLAPPRDNQPPFCALSLPGRGRPCPGPSLTHTPRDEAGPTRDPTAAGAAALGPRPSRLCLHGGGWGPLEKLTLPLAENSVKTGGEVPWGPYSYSILSWSKLIAPGRPSLPPFPHAQRGPGLHPRSHSTGAGWALLRTQQACLAPAALSTAHLLRYLWLILQFNASHAGEAWGQSGLTPPLGGRHRAPASLHPGHHLPRTLLPDGFQTVHLLPQEPSKRSRNSNHMSPKSHGPDPPPQGGQEPQGPHTTRFQCRQLPARLLRAMGHASHPTPTVTSRSPRDPAISLLSESQQRARGERGSWPQVGVIVTQETRDYNPLPPLPAPTHSNHR